MQSDVWSFGIVLHEIFTDAELPYGDMANQKVWLEVQVGGPGHTGAAW